MHTRTPVLVSLMFVAGAILLASCATMISGTTQEMSFQSSPDNVVVTLIRMVRDPGDWTNKTQQQGTAKPQTYHEESRVLGKTPLIVQLDKVDDPQSVVFSKEAYKPVTMKLETRLNGWFWGNLVFGGFFGSTTDSLSGAANEYAPSQFFVTLTPVMSTAIENGMGQPARDKALAFIVRRHAAILANLSQGGGEDWTALMSLLSIGPGHEAEARQKIQALALVYPDTALFATHVTDLYLKK